MLQTLILTKIKTHPQLKCDIASELARCHLARGNTKGAEATCKNAIQICQQASRTQGRLAPSELFCASRRRLCACWKNLNAPEDSLSTSDVVWEVVSKRDCLPQIGNEGSFSVIVRKHVRLYCQFPETECPLGLWRPRQFTRDCFYPASGYTVELINEKATDTTSTSTSSAHAISFWHTALQKALSLLVCYFKDF